MIEVFSSRSLIYWWGLLTSTLFVREWLHTLAKLFNDGLTFTPDKIPFNLVPGINVSIDNLAELVRSSIQFDPAQVIATVGSFQFPGWALALTVGIVILALGVRLYVRALRSKAWYDDFLTLIILYFVLRLEGHIIGATKLPLLESFKLFVDNPTVTFIVLLLLMLLLSFFGEGWSSKRAFWRALLEALMLALFIYPRETALVLGNSIEGLAQFGATLVPGVNVPFALAWGVLGMVLAVHRLTASDRVGGGGGGEVNVGGHAGDDARPRGGGLFGRFRRSKKTAE